jgi:hypothetical protein
MTQLPGTQFASQPAPLTADEKARGVENFAPFVADALLSRGWFRVTADTADRVELFQAVARRVGDMLGRPVVSYAGGGEIVIAFRQQESAQAVGRGTLSIQG